MVSSNKTETHPEKPYSKSGPILANTNISICPKPFIDKISIVVTPDKSHGHEMYKAFFSDLGILTTLIDAPKPKNKEYTFAKRIVLDCLVDVKKYPHIQIGYDSQSQRITKFRLEFVPVDLQPTGMEELHIVLGGWIEDGWEYVRNHGQITRLDIAMDFPNLYMESFLLLPAQGISSRTWSFDGRLQTVTLGKKSGNQTLIYDRGEKRKSKGQPFLGKVGVRVERRITKLGNSPVSKIASFKNPFATITLLEKIPPLPPVEATSKPAKEHWQLFCDSVRVRQLTNALAVISDERRTIYRKHLKQHAAPWWNPDAIWTHWPVMLEEMIFTGKLPLM